MSSRPFPITDPLRSNELAEFAGILLGDGGITKYQVTLTLHSRNDELYSKFVIDLIKKLFGVQPAVYSKKDALAINIVVSRKELVSFCKKELNLPIVPTYL